jgi:tetratricopeptide (TPR) repeat protein
MDKDLQELFDKASREPGENDIFAKKPKRDADMRDVFGGGEDVYELIENSRTPTVGSQTRQAKRAVKQSASKFLSLTYAVIIINIVTITAVFAYILLRPNEVEVKSNPEQDARLLAEAIRKQTTLSANELNIQSDQAKILSESASWQLGEKLYRAGQYNESYYVFSKLVKTLDVSLAGNEYLQDFLKLRMALALHKSGKGSEVSGLFSDALMSNSPVVRAMANYYMMFIEFEKKDYLRARRYAYKAIALSGTIDEFFGPGFESDCYFLICEALTSQLLSVSNDWTELPGKLWSDSTKRIEIPMMDQDQLKGFLQSGVFKLGEGAIAPKIKYHKHMKAGSRWSLVCFDSPAGEVLGKMASATEQELVWPEKSNELKNSAVSAYLTSTSEQRLIEIVAGSAGLIAFMDLDEVAVKNPGRYEQLAEFKEIINSEAIIAWRRFLLRFRGDHRAANAHLALGILQEYAGNSAAALGEYKIVSYKYANNDLAPYSLLYGSRLKTNLKDYEGAGEDLQELLIQYPDCKLVDKATLYLAEATLGSGLYDKAAGMFRKAYNLDFDPESQRSAAFGLARCYFNLERYEDAKKWFTITIKLINDTSDHRLKIAYQKLGRTLMELGEYEQASLALRNGIDSSSPPQEYIDVTLKLVESEAEQKKFVSALNIIQNVPSQQLDQENAVKVLIARAFLIRQMGITEAAISMLRHKIEFVPDSYLRALMTIELAECYMDTEDYSLAKKELRDALYDLPPGSDSIRARAMLSEIYLRTQEYQSCINICSQLIRETTEPEVTKKLNKILGDAYSGLGEHKQAALAYGGLMAKAETGAETEMETK